MRQSSRGWRQSPGGRVLEGSRDSAPSNRSSFAVCSSFLPLGAESAFSAPPGMNPSPLSQTCYSDQSHGWAWGEERSSGHFNSFIEIEFTYHVIQPLKVLNSVFLMIDTGLVSHRHDLILRHFLPAKRNGAWCPLAVNFNCALGCPFQSEVSPLVIPRPRAQRGRERQAEDTT